MAATYSPTMQRSTIGDAGCVGGSAASLPRHALSAALSAPPCSASLRAPLPRLPLCARLRLYPAPLMHREDNGAAHSWDITKKVSLKSLSLFFFEHCEIRRKTKPRLSEASPYMALDFMHYLFCGGQGCSICTELSTCW